MYGDIVDHPLKLLNRRSPRHQNDDQRSIQTAHGTVENVLIDARTDLVYCQYCMFTPYRWVFSSEILARGMHVGVMPIGETYVSSLRFRARSSAQFVFDGYRSFLGSAHALFTVTVASGKRFTRV